MPDTIRKYLLVSTLIHIILFAVLWFDPSLNAEPEKPYKVTFVQLSKGDGGNNLKANYKKAKDLPQTTVKEQKLAQKNTKDKTGSDLKSIESAYKKRLDALKTSQQKTDPKGGINVKNRNTGKKTQTSNALARIEQQLKQREVQLEAGQSKTGESGQSEFGGLTGTKIDPKLISYYNTIKRKINREWVVSKSEFSGPLRTKIIVMIDSHGNIIRSRFKRASGNSSFDASAMRAVRRSAPFPTPPSSIRKEALNEGFLIEFNPNSVTGRI